MTINKRQWFVGLVSLQAATALGSTMSVAQTAPQVAGIEEVVVTARRREETLQDVPIAVSAFNAQALENIDAANITVLQQVTPNLTLQVARGSNSTLIAFIRGIGQQDPVWSFEPGVGLYIDDVYMARPQGAVLEIFDIDHVEVLRGPQGTLYGRNTIGGAIKYVSRRLGDDVEGHAKLSAGTYGQADGVVSFSAPIAPTLKAGGAVGYFSRSGYGKNLTTGAEAYNQKLLTGRLTAEWTPSDSLFVRVTGDRTVDKSNPNNGHREAPYLTSLVLPGVYDTQAAGLGDKNYVMNQGVSVLAEWKFNDQLTAKSISAYREGHTDTVIDFDSTPTPYLDVPATYADEQFSQEFQLLYQSERVQGVAGFYYMNSVASGEFDTVVGNPLLAALGYPRTTATYGKTPTRSVAVFGDVSFNVTDALSVSAGLRWTHDKRIGAVYRADYTGLRSPYQGAPNATRLLVRTDYRNTRTFEPLTPRVSVSYKISPDFTTYAAYSKGFKSGGFDPRGDAILTPTTSAGFNAEKVNSYEVGLKGGSPSKTFTFAAAGFYSQYRDQQVTLQSLVGTTVASQVQNAGRSRIWGTELEGTAHFTSELSATLSLGYTNAKFQQYLALVGTTVQDVSTQRLFQNTPKWNGSFALTYRPEADVMGGGLAITGWASFRSKYSMFEIPSQLDQSGYTLANADIVWTSGSGRYELGLHGKNLTDKHYRVGGYNFPGATLGNTITGYYGPPRTVTGSIGVKL